MRNFTYGQTSLNRLRNGFVGAQVIHTHTQMLAWLLGKAGEIGAPEMTLVRWEFCYYSDLKNQYDAVARGVNSKPAGGYEVPQSKHHVHYMWSLDPQVFQL